MSPPPDLMAHVREVFGKCLKSPNKIEINFPGAILEPKCLWAQHSCTDMPHQAVFERGTIELKFFLMQFVARHVFEPRDASRPRISDDRKSVVAVVLRGINFVAVCWIRVVFTERKNILPAGPDAGRVKRRFDGPRLDSRKVTMILSPAAIVLFVMPQRGFDARSRALRNVYENAPVNVAYHVNCLACLGQVPDRCRQTSEVFSNIARSPRTVLFFT